MRVCVCVVCVHDVYGGVSFWTRYDDTVHGHHRVGDEAPCARETTTTSGREREIRVQVHGINAWRILYRANATRRDARRRDADATQRDAADVRGARCRSTTSELVSPKRQ